jgi:hypothetical protein
MTQSDRLTNARFSVGSGMLFAFGSGLTTDLAHYGLAVFFGLASLYFFMLGSQEYIEYGRLGYKQS